MADPWQLALLKRSVAEWNTWYKNYHSQQNDFRGANLNGADLRGVDLHRAYLSEADLTGAVLRGADLTGADLNGVDLSEADLTGAVLRGADLTGAVFYRANLTGADLTGADLNGIYIREAKLTNAKRGPLPEKDPPHHPSTPSASPDWLSQVETIGASLFVGTGTLASIIQGLDVVERRWRERQEKRKQAQPSSTPPFPTSAQTTSPAPKKAGDPDDEIIEILVQMEDGTQYGNKRWISDPDELRAYIDACNDNVVKPFRVTFMKPKGRALAVDITKRGKDTPQLNIILGYLQDQGIEN
jgi:uncharacterized protein YjbI with pentapeptide repeats